MAAADKKMQIPFFRYMSFLLKVEFRTPCEWDLTCRELREGAEMAEKYFGLAWFSDQNSNLRVPEGTEKMGRAVNLKGHQ